MPHEPHRSAGRSALAAGSLLGIAAAVSFALLRTTTAPPPPRQESSPPPETEADAPVQASAPLRPPASVPLTVPESSSLVREYAVALATEGRFGEAAQVLSAVLARRDAEAADHVRLGLVFFGRWLEERGINQPQEVGDGHARAAIEHCRAGLALDEAQASGHYVLGVLAVSYALELEPAAAIAPLRRACELAPGDVGAAYHLAFALDQEGERAAAIDGYRRLHALGREFTGVDHGPALYRLAQLLVRSPSTREEGGALLAEHRRLPEPVSKEQDEKDQAYGSLGKLRAPAASSDDPTDVEPARVTFLEPLVLTHDRWGDLTAFELADLDGDGRDDLCWLDEAGLATLPVRFPRPIAAGEAIPSVPDLAPRRIASGRFDGLIAAEVEHDPDGRASLVTWGPAGVQLWSNDPGGFVAESTRLPGSAASLVARAVVPVDFDHDGNLDLLVLAGDEALHLWRNRGAPRRDNDARKSGPVAWEDVTATTGFSAWRADWAVTEDFDVDHDVDLLIGGEELPTRLLSNLRRGRFEAIDAARSGLPDRQLAAPLVGDLDHDGRVDLLAFGAAPRFLKGDGALRFEDAEPPPGVARGCSCDAVFVDADLDGRPEWREADRAVDVDLDGDVDLFDLVEGQVEVRRGEVEGAPRRALLRLTGRRDNSFATGAVVEVRSGARYQRRYVRHPLQLFCFAGANPPIVRITWPDGVTQHPLQERKREDLEPLDEEMVESGAFEFVSDSEILLDLAQDHRLRVRQKKGPPGSCPFLWFWNGRDFEFLTDALGATPLGLPIDERRFVAPDHDELLRLPPDRFVPVDGEWRLQLTEELREVTYLDRAELWVVDHPAEVRIEPEERFCFPPFPPTTLHALRGEQPVRARDQDGRDWSGEVGARDDVPAVPFTPLPPQFRGLATRHALELALPEAARDAARIRLVMTGWLEWGDASVNLAIARTESLEFLPPQLSVPDGRGGWRDTGPPVGFPAGKTKTMVLDVTALLDRADLRLRVTSTLELYWDRIAVALDDEPEGSAAAPEAALAITKLDAKSARLWERGFSRPLPRRPFEPERYDWRRLEPVARFDQHAGHYTRHGDVAPLLDRVDDRFVILGSGDALDLRFDATSQAPPAPGRARTCLLFLDGYAKDGDLNTVSSQSVEPLPFHAMSGYPYRSEEEFPHDPLHARWRAEWNTRPGRRLLPDLAEVGNGAPPGSRRP
jgi:tetratricopeptide (TPR) repeat protein